MKYYYNTQGTCSKQILLDIDADNVIQDIQFIGGCMGNLQGICALARGQKIQDVAQRLKGIDCGGKGTSCPDQLSIALLKILEKHQAEQAKK